MDPLDDLQQPAGVRLLQPLRDLLQNLAVHHPEHLYHVRIGNLGPAERKGLV